jgi:hypothetical protein
MKVVYVAGPFRGANGWKIEQNIRRAEELGIRVAEAGAMPLIPHANTRFFHGTCTDQFWLDGTMELLRRCDAIIMTENWEESSGAKSEYHLAMKLRLPIFHEGTFEVLSEWARLR